MKHLLYLLLPLASLAPGKAFSQDLLLLLNGPEIPCKLLHIDSLRLEYQPLGPLKQIEKSEVKEMRTDSLLLMNGNAMAVVLEMDSFERHSPYLFYREPGKRVKSASIYQVFNIRYRQMEPALPYQDSLRIRTDEKVIYQQDTMARKYELTPNDMRAWVMGRRSARRNFHSPLSTMGAAATGLAGGVLLNYFFSYAPAVIFTVVNITVKPKVKKVGPEDIPFLQNEYFQNGYRMQATKIKLKNSLIGGLPAVVAGVLINYYLVP
jgi:hypothetical protein